MSGAAVWLIHGILMLVAAANLLSLVGLGGSSSNLFLIASAFRAYGWALLALLVAGALYGVGWSLLGRWGLPVSKERMMGGVLFLGYGFHAGVTLALLPGVAYVFYAWVAGAYIAWLVGSILLLLAARAVAGSVRRPAGTGLKAYAMANLLGVKRSGPIGLMAIAVARACGCSTLFATEVNPHRAALAKPLGADEVINPAETDAVARVRQATGGTGVDVLLEMSGNPTAIQQGFKMLRAGGRASLLGIPNKPVNLDLVEDVIFKGATVQGIYGRKMFDTWVQMTALLKSGRLNLDSLFHERYSLEGFQDAFALLEGGQAGKVLFYPNGNAELSRK